MEKTTEVTYPTLRVIRFPELYRKIGLCRTQVWRLEKEDEFPKSIPLGRNSKGWLEHEIDAWLLKRRNSHHV